MYNIHVHVSTTDDDDRRIVSSLAACCFDSFAPCVFTFSRSLSLKYFIKKAFAIVLQKLVSHIYCERERDPYKKERRQRIVFFFSSLFLLHI